MEELVLSMRTTTCVKQAMDNKLRANATTNGTSALKRKSRKLNKIERYARKRFGNVSDGADVQLEQAEKKNVFRSWWNVGDDGYIIGNLCRVLKKAGHVDELVRFWKRALWLVKPLQKKGINGAQEGVRIAEDVARKKASARKEVLK